MSKTKATEAALFIGENEEILFLAFLGRLFRLCRWSFLLVWCRIELVCDEDDAVVLGALLINPLVWLEVALDGEQCGRGRSGCTPTDLGVQGCKGQRF